MKTLMLGMTISNLLLSTAFAKDEMCVDQPQYGNRWTTERCITVGTTSAAATGSGIYAAAEYSAANSIVKKHSIEAFKKNSGSDHATTVNMTNSSFADGDRITIDYLLSEGENRALHIGKMETRALWARTAAITYGVLAVTASQQNPVTKTSEPDLAARAMYAGLAATAYSNAQEYSAEAKSARNGGPVPAYPQKKVISTKEGTAKLSADFVNEQIFKGGKITKISRLPAEHFAKYKALVWKGRGGAVTALTATGLAIEEYAEGHGAEEARRAAFVPQVKEFYSNVTK